MPLSSPAPLPRRLLLQTLASLAAGMGSACSFHSGVQVSRPSPAPEEPKSPQQVALANQWRALSRLGYGPTAAMLRQIQGAASAQSWALQQIDQAWSASQSAPWLAEDVQDINAPLPQIFDGVQRERKARASLKTADAAPAPQRARLDFSTPPEPQDFNHSMVEKTSVWRLQACAQPEHENPLLARLTEFWFNHLNVYIGKGPVRPFVGHYLINVARGHALGRFEDLLLASARHPAMLHYLDQVQSVAADTRNPPGGARGLNENYARELMELHTLGVDGGYSQTDVRELARVLTGWTVAPYAGDGFRFVFLWHDTLDKTVLGHTYPQGFFSRGEAEGEQAIRMLARQPQTARRLSLRLAQFFVADKPSADLVQRLSQVFLQNQGEIRPWLQALVQSPEFWDPANRLFKTPMDYACSALTATRTTQVTQDRRALLLAIGFLANAGQPLHGWQTPDGYPTDAATWLAPEALTRRADFALALGRQAEELDFLLPFMGSATRQTLAQQKPAQRNGLLLASPEFMYK